MRDFVSKPSEGASASYEDSPTPCTRGVAAQAGSRLTIPNARPLTVQRRRRACVIMIAPPEQFNKVALGVKLLDGHFVALSVISHSVQLVGKSSMHDDAKVVGLRARKRQQTLQRISEVALQLFVARGYEATTLEEISAAAGISRRTFFYYFNSKDDILHASVGVYADDLKVLVIESVSTGTPLEVVRDAVLKLVGPDREAQMIAIARLIRQSASLRARNHGRLQQLEQSVLEGLCERWPKKEDRDRWRVVAMISVGALRLASDSWIEQDGKRPLARYVQEVFKRLATEI